MSLEAKIEELIAAVNANTEALNAARGTVNVVNTGSAPAGDGDGEKRGRGRPKKDESEKAGAKADAPAKKEEPKAAAVDDDTVRAVFGEFMGVDDPAEREKRKDFVKGLLKDYGVAKALEIPDGKRAEAIEKVKAEGERLAAEAEDELV